MECFATESEKIFHHNVWVTFLQKSNIYKCFCGTLEHSFLMPECFWQGNPTWVNWIIYFCWISSVWPFHNLSTLSWNTFYILEVLLSSFWQQVPWQQSVPSVFRESAFSVLSTAILNIFQISFYNNCSINTSKYNPFFGMFIISGIRVCLLSFQQQQL